MCSAMCSCSCSWAHCRKAHAIHTAHIHMHRATNSCMLLHFTKRDLWDISPNPWISQLSKDISIRGWDISTAEISHLWLGYPGKFGYPTSVRYPRGGISHRTP